VEDLAQKAGLSRSMLHRKLIKLTGKSATDLITERRLIRAKELLENNAATASEVAYKVGFSSPSYFNTVFKKYFKISPGRIRKNIAADRQIFSNGLRKEPEDSIRKRKRRLLYITLGIVLTVIIIGGIYYLSREKEPYEKSIAILPFDNLSPDIENQYFADGIVEDLLNRLSSIKDLKVISRTSSEMFRNKGNKSIPEIANILGVSHILEGSVQREVNNIKISVQLIDAKNDDHILSKQYNRNIGEVFKIQGEIAGQIANELSGYLSDQQMTEIKRNQTDNLEAFNYYQIGRINQSRGTRTEVLSSIKYYKKAIQADSNYALAYAALAGTYYQRTYMGHAWIENLEIGKDSAVKLALKALDINENLAEAHIVLGNIYGNFDYDYKAAEREYLKAIELGNVGQDMYAWLLIMTGRPEKAREYMNKAVFLDPVTLNSRLGSAELYIAEQNYNKALEELKICLELEPNHYFVLESYCLCNLFLGNEKAAYESLRKVGPIYRAYLQDQAWGYTLDQADSAYSSSGMEGLIKFHLRKMGAHLRNARFYLVLGEYEKAIDMLEILYNNDDLRPGSLPYFYIEKMESNPRFIALKKKFGLQDY
jgi:TolB-like protein/AraC-like DNA-binding protein